MMQILNIDGSVKFTNKTMVNCPQDSTVSIFPVTKPADLDSVYFVKLELKKDGELISQNVYMRGFNEDSTGGMGHLDAITRFPTIKLLSVTNIAKMNDHWDLKTTITNNTKYPAINVRLKVVGSKSGKRILPVIYNDNYFILLPGDQRTIKIELQDADTMGERPSVEVEGFNVASKE
jgi:exo-1,4-beta-D-glucosaminidase